MKKSKRTTVVSQLEFAKRAKVDRSTISNLTAKGILFKDRNGKYPFSENLERFQAHEETKSVRTKLGTAEVAGRTKLLVERIRKLKIENDERERKLISLDEAMQRNTYVATMVKTRLLQIPVQCAPLISGMQPVEAEALLRDRITKALEAMQGGKWLEDETY